MSRFFDTAYIKDGHITHTRDAMMLAVLMHTAGGKRESNQMNLVRKLMLDQNYESTSETTYEPSKAGN